MNVDRLLQRAHYFHKLAQTDQYDAGARNALVNTAPNANSFSFRQIATVVLQDLTAADREEKDPAATAASHALLDILNSVAVPDTNAMLTAAQQAAQVIRQKYPQDINKQKIANYLVNVVRMLINKNTAPTGAEEAPASRESFSQFLNELYYKLRNNQPLDEEAKNKWHTVKDWYVRRLNGLNGSPSLTSARQQEKYILNYVLNRVAA
jgi:hypothetical protein